MAEISSVKKTDLSYNYSARVGSNCLSSLIKNEQPLWYSVYDGNLSVTRW